MSGVPARGSEAARPEGSPPPRSSETAAGRLVRTLSPSLAALVEDVLARNPEVARARAAAEAARLRAPQVSALPDPMAGLTAFMATPETRVGPQEATVTIAQRFPWLGKLALREREALYRAAAAAEQVQAQRLALVTETRRLVYELAFLDAQESEVRTDRATLVHYEELARARYASGVGLEQAVVKIQAEITKDDNRLLEIATRRAVLVASLNALRDRPGSTELPDLHLPTPPELPELSLVTLGAVARDLRPEIAAARHLIDAAKVTIDSARKEYRPDVTVGLGYTLVGKREDPAGRSMPPPDNGDDILGLTVGINLPVWRQKLAAGVEEAASRETAAREELRSVATSIDRSLSDLIERLPLTLAQLSLFEDLLVLQAEEALRSAEAAYAAGSVGALDLLDAERILLDVRIATARSRADYLIAIARLEGAVGAPAVEISRRNG